MKYRKLRIAWSVAWAVACLLLIALWVRSQNRVDQITWHYNNSDAFQVSAASGSVVFLTFVDVPLTIPRPGYQIRTQWFESMRLINGKTHWWFELKPVGTSRYVRIPDWFLVLIFCGLGATPWLPWRFSLRTLLIATTAAAIGLGLVVYVLKK